MVRATIGDIAGLLEEGRDDPPPSHMLVSALKSTMIGPYPDRRQWTHRMATWPAVRVATN